MNYQLLSKLAMEENDRLKNDVSILRRRNEILRTEVERLEALLKNMEKEKQSLKEETNSKEEVASLKKEEEIKKEEIHRFTHYS